MKKRIMLVDDDETILTALEIVLRSLGYDTYCASDGPEALDIFREHGIRVCFLDMRLPTMDSMTVCRTMKEISPDSLVYAFSGYAERFTPEQYDEAGFDGRFDKPVRLEELEEACKRAFEKLDAQG